jgi:GTPase SAR1 family protein
MPSSLFLTRAQAFAENIGDAAAKRQIEQYLRHEDYPGPIVTFVGAVNRGKTTLFRKAANDEIETSSTVQFAGAALWKKPFHAREVPNGSFTEVPSDVVRDVLLCDASAFDASENDSLLSSLLPITDMAVVAVQITQPAGAEEVAFVRERLAEVPSVLVLTKCDQADEDDFQEGLEAVLDNYGDFPWLAVVLSDLDGSLQETTARGQSLIRFEQWWSAEGQKYAEEARQAHLQQMDQKWREQARCVLDDKEQIFTPMFQEVSQALSSSSGVNEALRLQQGLMEDLNKLPDIAVSHYRSRLPDLTLEVIHVTDNLTDSIRAGKEIERSQIESRLSAVYQAWDQEARQFVQDRMQADVEKLHQSALRYDELVKVAMHIETGHEMTHGAEQREEVFTEHLRSKGRIDLQGSFDLTVSDKLRAVAMPTVSALGTGVLLLTVVGATIFAPFAPIIALFGAGAMGIGTGGAASQANQQKRISHLKEAINRQAINYQHQLVRQMETEWKEFSDQVRETVAASKRRLNILLLEQSPDQDDTLKQKHAKLSSNLTKIASLRRDLHWLEEHDKGAAFLASMQE